MKFKKIKQFLLDCVSFNTPQARLFNFLMLFLLLAIVPTSQLGYSPIKCVFKFVILPLIFRGNCPTSGFFADCDCPGCGLTRGMSRLLHGDVVGAYNFNWLVFPVFIGIMYFVVSDSIKVVKHYKKTGKIL